MAQTVDSTELVRQLEPLTALVCEATRNTLALRPLSLTAALEKVPFFATGSSADTNTTSSCPESDDTHVLALRGYQLVYALLGSAAATSKLHLLHAPWVEYELPSQSADAAAPAPSLYPLTNATINTARATAPTTTLTKSVVTQQRVTVTHVLAHWVWLSLWCWAEAMCRASDGLLALPPIDGLYRRAATGLAPAAEESHSNSSNTGSAASVDAWGGDAHHSLPCPYLTPSCFVWPDMESSKDGEPAQCSRSAEAWQTLVHTTQAQWRTTVAPSHITSDKPAAESESAREPTPAVDRRMRQLHALVTLCEHYRRLETFLTVALMRLDQRVVEERLSTPAQQWHAMQADLAYRHATGDAAAAAAGGGGVNLPQRKPPKRAYPFAPVSGRHPRVTATTRGSRVSASASGGGGGAGVDVSGISSASGGGGSGLTSVAMTLSRRLLSAVMGRLVAHNAAALVRPVLRWSVRQFMRRAHIMGASVATSLATRGTQSSSRRARKNGAAEREEEDEDDEDDLIDDLDADASSFMLSSAPASPHRALLATGAGAGAAAGTTPSSVFESATAAREASWRRRRYTLEVNLKRLSRVLLVIEDCRVRQVMAWVRHSVCVVCTGYGQEMSQLLLRDLADVPPIAPATLLQQWPLAADAPPTNSTTAADASRALREAIQGYVRLRSCLLFLMAGTAHMLDDVTALGRRCILSGLSHFLDGFSSGDVFARFMARWGVPLWRQLCEGTFRMEQEAALNARHAQTRGRARQRAQPPQGAQAAKNDANVESDKESHGSGGGGGEDDDADDQRSSAARTTGTGTVHSYGEARSQSTINVEHQRQAWVRQQLTQPAPGQRQGRLEATTSAAQGGVDDGTGRRGLAERGASSIWWPEEGSGGGGGGEADDAISQLDSHLNGGGVVAVAGAAHRPANLIIDRLNDDATMDRFELHEVATLPADGFPSLIYLLSRKEHVRRRMLGVFCEHVKQFFVLSLAAEEGNVGAEDADPLHSVQSPEQQQKAPKRPDESLLPPRTFRACVLALKTTMDSFDGLHNSQFSPPTTRRASSSAIREAETSDTAAARGMLNAADEAFGLGRGDRPTLECSDRSSSDEEATANGARNNSSSSSSAASSVSRDSRGRRRHDVVGGGGDDGGDMESDAENDAGEFAVGDDVEATPWAALLEYHQHRRQQHQDGLSSRPEDAHGNRVYSAAEVAHMAVYKGISLFFAAYESQASYTLAQALTLRVEQHRRHMKREAAALLQGTGARPSTTTATTASAAGGDMEDAVTTSQKPGKRSTDKAGRHRHRQQRTADAMSGVGSPSAPQGIVHVPSAQDDGIDLLIALISLLPSKEIFMARFLQLQAPYLLRLRHADDLQYEGALRRRLTRQLGSISTNPYTVLLRDVRRSFQSRYIRLMDRLDGYLRQRERRQRRGKTQRRRGGAGGTRPMVATVMSTAMAPWTAARPTPAHIDAAGSTSSQQGLAPQQQQQQQQVSSPSTAAPTRFDNRGRPIGDQAIEEDNEDIRRARIFLGLDPEAAPEPATTAAAVAAAKNAAAGGAAGSVPQASSASALVGLGVAAASPHPGRDRLLVTLKEAAPAPFLLQRVHFLCETWWRDYTDLSLSATRLRKQYERGGWWSESLVDAALRFEWYVKGAGQGRRQKPAAAQLLNAWDQRSQLAATSGGSGRVRAGHVSASGEARARNSVSATMSVDSSSLTGPESTADPMGGSLTGAPATTHSRSLSSSHAVDWVSASVSSLPSRLLRAGAGWVAPSTTATTTAVRDGDQRLVTFPGYGDYCLLQGTLLPAETPLARTADAAAGAVATSHAGAAASPTSALSRAAVVQGFSSVFNSAVQQSNQIYGNLRRTGAALGFELSERSEDEEADLAEAYGGFLSPASPPSNGSERSASVTSTAATNNNARPPSVRSAPAAAGRAGAGGTDDLPYTPRTSHITGSEDGDASTASYRAHSLAGLTTWSGVPGAHVAMPPNSNRAYRHVRWPLANGELTFAIHSRRQRCRVPAQEKQGKDTSSDSVTVTGPPIVLVVLQALDRLHDKADGQQQQDDDSNDGTDQRRRGGTFDALQAALPIALQRPLLAALLAQLVTSGVVYREAELVKPPPTSTTTAASATHGGRRRYCYRLCDGFAHLATRKVTVELTEMLLQRGLAPWFTADETIEETTAADRNGGFSSSLSSSSASSLRAVDGNDEARAVKTAAATVGAHSTRDVDAPDGAQATELPPPFQSREPVGTSRYVVEAHIARTLKSGDGPIAHEVLYEAVKAHCVSFALTRDVFKEAITRLIERQFVERDEGGQSYRYLP